MSLCMMHCCLFMQYSIVFHLVSYFNYESCMMKALICKRFHTDLPFSFNSDVPAIFSFLFLNSCSDIRVIQKRTNLKLLNQILLFPYQLKCTPEVHIFIV